MQSLDDLLAFLLLSGPIRVLMQEAIQVCIINENLRAYKIQKCEKLFQVVLQRSPCDQ